MKENQIINWLDRVEGYGEGRTAYMDNNLPMAWTPRKHHIPKISKRYTFFNKLKKESDGCAICGLKVNLVIDHCHVTRKIRGILCQNCNHGIGKFKDNTDFLNKASEYLKKDYTDALDYYTLK